jgi:hypothetical protein
MKALSRKCDDGRSTTGFRAEARAEREIGVQTPNPLIPARAEMSVGEIAPKA